MMKIGWLLALIWSVVWLISCAPRRKLNETIQKYHRTGEAIAVNELIQQFERDHSTLYKREINNGDHLEWPALNNKNLSNYCKNYLQWTISGGFRDNVIGIQIKNTLHYEKTNTNATCEIDIVQCKVKIKQFHFSCYMTRALEPNCVYALKLTRNQHKFILSIINKHCDIEDQPSLDKPLKRKIMDVVQTKHSNTRQPIANDDYLMEYELEHQELVERENDDGRLIKWLHVMEHPNLDLYCYQYLEECVPQKNRGSVTGKWKVQKLHYQKINTIKDINVTTVSCQTNDASKLQYHITRAPESNCVYALLRRHRGPHCTFIIIFKHCDFNETNDQKTISKNCNLIDKDVIIKSGEVKEETFGTIWETM